MQCDEISLILYAIIFFLIGVIFYKYYVTKSEPFGLQFGGRQGGIVNVSMMDLKYIIISFTSIDERKLKLKDIALLIGKIGKQLIETKARIMKGDLSQEVTSTESIKIQSGETWEKTIITLIQDIGNINTVKELHNEIPKIVEQLLLEEHKRAKAKHSARPSEREAPAADEEQLVGQDIAGTVGANVMNDLIMAIRKEDEPALEEIARIVQFGSYDHYNNPTRIKNWHISELNEGFKELYKDTDIDKTFIDAIQLAINEDDEDELIRISRKIRHAGGKRPEELIVDLENRLAKSKCNPLLVETTLSELDKVKIKDRRDS